MIDLPSFGIVFALVQLIIGFGLLIFVHELGHFIAAKAVGIKVTQFAIGFGHSLFAWRKGIGVRLGSTEKQYAKMIADGADPESLGETEYRLNWMPLGGYVKMLGQEDLNPTADSQDPRSYTAKSVGARAIVISAGVVMNLIFAVIFFIIAFMQGVAFPGPTIGLVVPNGPAATTYAAGHDGDPQYLGLRVGDQVVSIDGEPIGDFNDIKMATALAAPDTKLKLAIDRPERDKPLIYNIQPEVGPQEDLLWLGIGPSVILEVPAEATVEQLPKAFANAGVQPGMKLVTADGQPVEAFYQVHRSLVAAMGKPVPLGFAAPGQDDAKATVELAATPGLTIGPDGTRSLLGILPAICVTVLVEDKPAEQAGVQVGDVLMRLGDVGWPSNIEKIQKAVEAANGKPMDVVLLRGQEVIEKKITPSKDKIGIVAGILPDAPPIVADVAPDSPAASYNWTPGTRITAIAGQPVKTMADWQRLTMQAVAKLAEDQPLPMTVELNIAGSPTEQAHLQLDSAHRVKVADAVWGMPGPLNGLESDDVTVKADNPLVATMLGMEKTGQFMVQTYVTLLRLIQGTVKPSSMRGPVGIADVGTKIAQRSFTYFLFFLGLISVNLAVINFLPIPIVDGGHIVFLIIEKIKGSPASPAIQSAATIAGLLLIGCVFLFVTYHDIARFFQ